jgi:hypothetical protein
MTYAESAVNQTISRLLSEHPDLDASTDGVLDSLDQFHIGGGEAVGLESFQGEVCRDQEGRSRWTTVR